MTEYSLHTEIKEWYSVIGGQVEVKVDDFIVDVVKDRFPDSTNIHAR